MQMVMCDKCKEPIDHRHKFEIASVNDRYFALHIQCDDPFGINHPIEDKVIPDFAYESPQKKAV